MPVYINNYNNKLKIKKVFDQDKKKLEKIGIKKEYIDSTNFLNTQNYVFWKRGNFLDESFFDYKYDVYWKDNIFDEKNYLIQEKRDKIDINFDLIVLNINYYYAYKKIKRGDNYFLLGLFIFFTLGIFYGNYSNDNTLAIGFTCFLFFYIFLLFLNLIFHFFDKRNNYYILRYKPDKLLLIKIK